MAEGDEKKEPVQQWLIPYENPLAARLEKEFFKQIPRTPGVYLMIDTIGGVLYVGKAKNLRNRISSYKNAKPGQVTRKTIRLVNQIREIHWEQCETETAALLRENQLLRELCPPYNVINTRPDTYYFIAVRWFSDQARFRLTVSSKRQGDMLFGVFKGRGRVREAYGALLRLLWAAQNRQDRFSYPAKLTRRSPPHLFTVQFDPMLISSLKKYLNGTDDLFLAILTDKLLENDHIPKFVYHVVQEDLEILKEFYLRGPKRNRRLRNRFGSKGRLIAQNQIDDLLVLEREALLLRKIRSI
jgi:excinuclease UvrABC nuclease subunit